MPLEKGDFAPQPPSYPSSPTSTRPSTRGSPQTDRQIAKTRLPAEWDGSAMEVFIHKHLQEILQPFADELEQAHSFIGQLSSQISQVASKANATSKELQQMSSLTEKLEDDVEVTMSKQATFFEKVDRQLKSMEDENKHIHQEVQMQDKKIKDLTDHEKKTHDHTMSEFGRSFAALEKLEKDLREFKGSEARAKSMWGERIVLLEKYQRSSSESLQQLTEGRDRDSSDLQSLTQKVEVRWEQDGQTLQSLRSSAAKLQTGFENHESRLRELSCDAVRGVISDVATLKRQVTATSRSQTVLEEKQRLTGRELVEAKENVKKLFNMVGSDADHKSHLSGMHLIMNVSKMKEAVSRGAAQTQEVLNANAKLSSELATNIARIEELELLEGKMEEEFAKLKQSMAMQMKEFEAAMDQNDQSKRITRLDAAREQDKAEVLAKVTSNSQELSKLQATQQQIGNHLQETTWQLQKLEGTVAGTLDEVAVIRAEEESSRDFWNGLTKGVEKVHQNVVKDGAVITPRPRKLPSLGLS
eukprot:TRINITY_DN39328_c0_g1_i1.p1 TRINITY_DN39328_c0_g1~~TRINITY_DN39328_c0_g1_i1.p1  ORF type:complete len:528 (-),score=150.78 TRINITY_DN39328_c0_g1_i1:17-1600(-)